MKSRQRVYFLASFIAVALVLATGTIALAHPLGNFTINRYAGLVIKPDAIIVDYVVDMAEIPAFQEISQVIGMSAEGAPDKAKAQAYSAVKCNQLLSKVWLALNGKSILLDSDSTDIEFPPGAGGLLTLRLTCEWHAAFSNMAPPNTLGFRDGNFADRIGWREIVAQEDGVTLRKSTVGRATISDRLRSYPVDLLTNPPNQSQAQFEFDLAAASTVDARPITNSSATLDRTQDPFAALITASNLSLPVILVSLALAIGLGAAHAVSPGHGKTIMAAYLVGTRGTFAQAIVLGMTVTTTHTIGVLLLGLITLFVSQYILPERLYPWLSLLSGMLVIVMGTVLVFNRMQMARHEQEHHHAHASEDYHHEMGRHEHSHLPEGAHLSWKSLVGLGLAGGLVPSTSALILLLSAISLQRIPFGIVLIVAFGIGMALVLVGIGVLLVRASSLLEGWRAPTRLIKLLPTISAVVVICAGLVVTTQAFLQIVPIH